MDLLLEAGNQFPVGGDEGLFGFDLGDDLLLGSDGREGDFYFLLDTRLDPVDRCATLEGENPLAHSL